MAPPHTCSDIKSLRTERSHEENQERAFIAASRRGDRSIEARLESAHRASKVHKARTGRALRVTMETVLNEEMYEEEDDDHDLMRQRFIYQLQTQSDELSRKIVSFMAEMNHGKPRSESIHRQSNAVLDTTLPQCPQPAYDRCHPVSPPYPKQTPQASLPPHHEIQHRPFHHSSINCESEGNSYAWNRPARPGRSISISTPQDFLGCRPEGAMQNDTIFQHPRLASLPLSNPPFSAGDLSYSPESPVLLEEEPQAPDSACPSREGLHERRRRKQPIVPERYMRRQQEAQSQSPGLAQMVNFDGQTLSSTLSGFPHTSGPYPHVGLRQSGPAAPSFGSPMHYQSLSAQFSGSVADSYPVFTGDSESASQSSGMPDQVITANFPGVTFRSSVFDNLSTALPNTPPRGNVSPMTEFFSGFAFETQPPSANSLLNTSVGLGVPSYSTDDPPPVLGADNCLPTPTSGSVLATQQASLNPTVVSTSPTAVDNFQANSCRRQSVNSQRSTSILDSVPELSYDSGSLAEGMPGFRSPSSATSSLFSRDINAKSTDSSSISCSPADMNSQTTRPPVAKGSIENERHISPDRSLQITGVTVTEEFWKPFLENGFWENRGYNDAMPIIEDTLE